MRKLKLQKAPEVIKLDLGCGKNKKDGFTGVDSIKFDNVDMVVNLVEREPFKGGNFYEAWNNPVFKPWPWENESVDEVHCSHFVEHLDAKERINFVNELYRILRTGGKATVITPHWSSNRAYGDLTHKWPPVSEMWFYYLDKSWREQNAPHNDFYKCDFICTWGYSLHPGILNRNQEFQQDAIQWKKEAAQDTICTFTKK